MVVILLGGGCYLLFWKGNLMGLVPIGFVGLGYVLKRFIGGD